MSSVADKFAAEGAGRLAAIADPGERLTLAQDLWAKLVRLGWAGLLVDASLGGAGGGPGELSAALEGAGRHALPLPILAAFGLPPALLRPLKEKASPLLIGLADGRRVFCPIIEPLARRAGSRATCGFTVAVGEGSVTIGGSILGVELVFGATDYLIAAPAQAGGCDLPVIVCIPACTPGIAMSPAQRLDGRATADIGFDCTLPRTAVLIQRAEVAAAVEQAADFCLVMSGVESVAAMGKLLELTIAYLKERRQFGVALASFQVLRHDVADMVVAYENACALLAGVLEECSIDVPASPELVSLLAIRLSEAGGFIARSAIQLHGGMGMTEELAATRLARRILMAEFEYGDADFHARRILRLRGNTERRLAHA